MNPDGNTGDKDKMGQPPFVPSTQGAVAANGDFPLFSLMTAMLDGQMSDADQERLADLLRDDAAAQEKYIDLCWTHALLRQELGDHAEVPSASDSFSADSDQFDEPLPVVLVDTSRQPQMSPFSLNSEFGGALFSYGVSAMIVAAMLIGAWAYKISHNQHFDAQVAGVNAPDNFAGRISGMNDCRWANPNQAPYAGSFVRLGRRFELDAGLLEISYNSGAKVILEGPCAYEVNSNAGGYLERGKLTARVEKNDELGIRNNELKVQVSDIHHSSFINHHLFSVHTPTALVTDLGTEFGVRVTPGGNTETYVFEGVVNVVAIAKEAKNRSLIRRLGESALVEPGESGVRAIVEDENTAERFVRSMPSPADRNRAYADYVLSLDPAVYYRMEMPESENEQHVVFDFASGGHHGKLLLNDEYGGSPYRPGRFGGSLNFRGPETPDRAIVHDYPKAAGDRLTVSAWVMAAGRPGWAHIAANWSGKYGDQDFEGQFELALYRQDGDLCARVRQRNGDVVEVREREPIPLLEWQHVALVLDGETARLYRNGREVDRRECVGVLPLPPVSGLGIGCRLNPASTDAVGDSVPGYDYWQGRIDELAVFNEALSEKTIRELYEAKRFTDALDGQEVGQPRNGE